MSQMLDNIHRIAQIADSHFGNDVGIYAPRLGGISQRQVAMLRAIATCDTPPSQTTLVEKTGIDRSTLADIVRRLLNKGWVSRRRTKDDARAYAVRLTDEGTKVLTAAKMCEARVERELLAAIPVLVKIRDLDLSKINRIRVAAGPKAGKRQTYQEPARVAR